MREPFSNVYHQLFCFLNQLSIPSHTVIVHINLTPDNAIWTWECARLTFSKVLHIVIVHKKKSSRALSFENLFYLKQRQLRLCPALKGREGIIRERAGSRT